MRSIDLKTSSIELKMRSVGIEIKSQDLAFRFQTSKVCMSSISRKNCLNIKSQVLNMFLQSWNRKKGICIQVCRDEKRNISPMITFIKKLVQPFVSSQLFSDYIERIFRFSRINMRDAILPNNYSNLHFLFSMIQQWNEKCKVHYENIYLL